MIVAALITVFTSVPSFSGPSCSLHTQQQAHKQACEMQYQVHGCEDLKNSLSEADRSSIKNCNDPSHLSDEVGVATTVSVCASALGENLWDLITSPVQLVAWAGKIEPPPPRIRSRMSLESSCQSAECKRQFLGEHHVLFTKEEIEGHEDRAKYDCRDFVNQNYCEGASLAVLMREVPQRLNRARRAQDPKVAHLPDFVAPWDREPDLQTQERDWSNIKDEILDDIFQKHQCYTPAARREMLCYGVFMILDPLAVAGGVSKLAKIQKFKMNQRSRILRGENLDNLSPCSFCNTRSFSPRAQEHVSSRHLSSRDPGSAQRWPEILEVPHKTYAQLTPANQEWVKSLASRRKGGSTSMFPPHIQEKDLERALLNASESTFVAKGDIDPRGFQKLEGEVNIFGEKYWVEVQVCQRSSQFCEDHEGRLFRGNEIMTVIPRCGPGVVDFLNHEISVRMRRKSC